jgi:hypothetical protein
MITSAEEFVCLRESEQPEEYWRAAHEEAPLDVWLRVIEAYPRMRAWVAHNKTVPLEILEILAADPDPNVRRVLASKRKLPPELQLQLASDPDESVRNRLASNARATEEALRRIARGQPGLAAETAQQRLRGTSRCG